MIDSKNKQLGTEVNLDSENKSRYNEQTQEEHAMSFDKGKMKQFNSLPQLESYNTLTDKKNRIQYHDVLTSPQEQLKKESNTFMPPPPPPPPPFPSLFVKKNDCKEDVKAQILQTVEHRRTLQAVKSDSNMNSNLLSKNVNSMRTTYSCNDFMTELQTKIQRSQETKYNLKSSNLKFLVF